MQGNTAALLILILPLHWPLFAHAGVHAGIGQEAGFASSSFQRKPLNCAQASVLLRRVECHASEYLGTLSVVTALVLFVGLSFGHGETKQSEDQRIALLTSVHPRQRLRRISESSFSWGVPRAYFECLVGGVTPMPRRKW
jgi:hypothetical protein